MWPRPRPFASKFMIQKRVRGILHCVQKTWSTLLQPVHRLWRVSKFRNSSSHDSDHSPFKPIMSYQSTQFWSTFLQSSITPSLAASHGSWSRYSNELYLLVIFNFTCGRSYPYVPFAIGCRWVYLWRSYFKPFVSPCSCHHHITSSLLTSVISSLWSTISHPCSNRRTYKKYKSFISSGLHKYRSVLAEHQK